MSRQERRLSALTRERKEREGKGVDSRFFFRHCWPHCLSGLWIHRAFAADPEELLFPSQHPQKLCHLTRVTTRLERAILPEKPLQKQASKSRGEGREKFFFFLRLLALSRFAFDLDRSLVFLPLRERPPLPK